MADYPALAILASIPAVLFTAIAVYAKHMRLAIFIALFAALLLFSIGYQMDTGNARAIFSTMVILCFVSIPAYFIFFAVTTIREFLAAFSKRAG